MMKIFNKIIFVLLCLLSIACNNQEQKDADQAKTDNSINSKIEKVEVVSPEKREFVKKINIVGEARPNQVVSLRAMENGAITRIYKDIGDRVKEGEVLAKLENPAISRNYHVLEAELEATKSNFERLNEIYEKTPALTSLSQVEAARADYKSTLAQYNASKKQLGFLIIKSPFDGVVTKRNVDKGATVQSGISNPNSTILFEIMDVETIRVTVPLPESDYRFVKPGTPVTVEFPELPGKKYNAEVSRISGAMDSGSKAANLEIDIDNKDLSISPGMYAEVTFNIKSREEALSLPNTALAIKEGKKMIYKVNPENLVELEEINVGIQGKNYFEVLNPDLEESAKVIIRGRNQVNAGMKVEPIKSGKNE
ncbi:hypothetical protein C7S20_07175 [Christiangramia fulva]|uniref:Uncharacterized protein n=1 Tax=Christiangramia fulva TaxID=2126553 RepID=A0A2R3Z467_9FLAO|nr:efflux RND transporter periplasmic adaptor subunit [Christiangramia fulva]AVR45067.1 hypothetical protein C7S20_07175 [Christiangramia fulva]